MEADDLSDPELQLWNAFPAGESVDLRVGDPLADDPARASAWGPERAIRASVIRALLLGARQSPPGQLAALHLAGARVVGDLDLSYSDLRHYLSFTGCSFADEVSIYGAHVRQIAFRGSRLARFNAAMAVIDGSLLVAMCRVTGTFDVASARISSSLILDGSELHNPGGDALRADHVRVGDDISARRAFTAHGTVNLKRAEVGGHLLIQGARLRAPGSRSLYASRMSVGGDLWADRVESEGELRFAGAQIAGRTSFAGAHLVNHDGSAIHAVRAVVGAHFHCHEDFVADGEVHFEHMRVAGDVRLDGAVLRTGSELSIAGRGMDVGGSVMCVGGFRAEGSVRFDEATIAGTLDFTGAEITANSAALVVDHLAARELVLGFSNPPIGLCSLSHAHVSVLSDRADPAAWPQQLLLDGFTYTTLRYPGSADQRVKWLERGEHDYLPQPYEHLASVYRQLGDDRQARRVLLAKERARRRTLPRAARWWGAAQDVAVGYGYRPERAFGWLIALLSAGTIIFSLHHPIPDKGPLPTFNPLIYTLDLLLPVIHFGQGSSYTPQGWSEWAAYVLTAAGWILATAIAAGLARAVNRS